ncbi:hypothetical protein BOG92_005070 [Streptomyces sp. WAC00263]|nr:hypothetical protein BOG92_005070 [Streptomyces sp. WAC00263]
MARPQAPVSVTVLGDCVADAFTDPARSSSDGDLRAQPISRRSRTGALRRGLGVRSVALARVVPGSGAGTPARAADPPQEGTPRCEILSR